MPLFPKTLRSQPLLLSAAWMLFIFSVIEGIQLLLYPLLISGLIADYHAVAVARLFPGHPVYSPLVLLPFVALNLILRITAWLTVRQLRPVGKILGILSALYTIALVAFMLPENIYWEPVVMLILIYLLIKGYKASGTLEPPAAG